MFETLLKTHFNLSELEQPIKKSYWAYFKNSLWSVLQGELDHW